MAKILINGKQFDIDDSKTLYPEEVVSKQSRQWQRQYYDYLRGDSDGWFHFGLYDLDPGKDDLYSGGNLNEVTVTTNKPTMTSYLSKNAKTNWNNEKEQYGHIAKTALSFVPYVGDAVDAYDIYQDAKQGNYGMALAGLGLLALPNFIEKPVKALGKGVKKILSARKVNKAITNTPAITSIVPDNPGIQIIMGDPLDLRLVDGGDQYKYRAARLGVDPDAYKQMIQDNLSWNAMDYKQWLIKELGFPEDKANLFVQKGYVRPSVHWNTRHKKGRIVNSPTFKVYTKTHMDPYDSYWLANVHEFTHLLQRSGADTNSKFIRNILNESQVNRMTDIFDFSKLPLKAKQYMLHDGGTEIIARIGQLKDALGLKPGEDLTKEMFDYLKTNYTKWFDDNAMTQFFESVINIDNFIKFANSPSVKNMLE